MQKKSFEYDNLKKKFNEQDLDYQELKFELENSEEMRERLKQDIDD